MRRALTMTTMRATTTRDASMRRPRTTRRNLPRPIARVPSSATSTSASARDDGTALDDDETFYAYDEDAWRAFERAFGTTPREPWFGPLQLALAVVLAGTVDAGWSGDWSRVGALTKAREADARAFVCASRTLRWRSWRGMWRYGEGWTGRGRSRRRSSSGSWASWTRVSAARTRESDARETRRRAGGVKT